MTQVIRWLASANLVPDVPVFEPSVLVFVFLFVLALLVIVPVLWIVGKILKHNPSANIAIRNRFWTLIATQGDLDMVEVTEDRWNQISIKAPTPKSSTSPEAIIAAPPSDP